MAQHKGHAITTTKGFFGQQAQAAEEGTLNEAAEHRILIG
jgi:hypothetical protein